MQNAPRYEPVYTLPGLTLDPECVRDYLFGGASYLPLAKIPLEDPPNGQILLVQPVPLPEDPLYRTRFPGHTFVLCRLA